MDIPTPPGIANKPPSSSYKIEGYADQLSVRAGDDIAFHISSDVETYALEISRVGADRQPVWVQDGLKGTRHPAPDNAATHGCGWPSSLRLTVPESWNSGYYSVTMQGTDPNGNVVEGELFFVVRSSYPGRDSSILLQLTTNTGNAYNTWGGSSLYRGPRGPATRVSFDRPYAGLAAVDGKAAFEASRSS